MLDIAILGGELIDGSGAPRRRADIGVKDGRITVIGALAEPAAQTIDATGKIVCPGFVDVHTHYDVQVFWDPKLSPSCFHGVTTVIGGLCGFSVAPLSLESTQYIKEMLGRVEGMPLSTLEAATTWDWSSFGEYLDRIDGTIGINAGFFVGHSPLRRLVMGERANAEEAGRDDLDRMKAVLGQSLGEGALGFSSTIASNHNDAAGNPVPSRWASFAEIVELGSVVRDYPGTGLELLPDVDFGPGIAELITDLSIAAQRPINWNASWVDNVDIAVDRVRKQLAVSDYARSRGGEVIALTTAAMPGLFLNFRGGLIFDSLPGDWPEVFRLPLDRRIAHLRDPEVRKALAADAASVPGDSASAYVARFGCYAIASVHNPANKSLEGRTVGDIASERGEDALDVMLDIALDDDLSTSFMPIFGGMDEATFAVRGKLWRDDRTVIGASDAGAHLDMIDSFAYCTTVLGKGVRDYGATTLEEAVHQLTQRPAQYIGLIDRGLVKEGYFADLVVFDERTVDRGPTYARFDVPGDEFRMYADAIGVDHVVVNGVPIIENGAHTGRLPGTVLRSGRDTRTVALDSLRDGRREI